MVECPLSGDAIGYPARLRCIAATVCVFGCLKNRKCSIGKLVDLDASYVLRAVRQVDCGVLWLLSKGCILVQSLYMQWLLPFLSRTVNKLNDGTANACCSPRGVHGRETRSTLLPPCSGLICKTAGTPFPLSGQFTRRMYASEILLGRWILGWAIAELCKVYTRTNSPPMLGNKTCVFSYFRGWNVVHSSKDTIREG